MQTGKAIDYRIKTRTAWTLGANTFQSLISVTLIGSEIFAYIYTDSQTDGHTRSRLATEVDQEYTDFMRSEMRPSARYINLH